MKKEKRMSNAQRKRVLEKVNERMRLNDQPIISMDEMKSMEKFKQAYELENDRIKYRSLKRIGVIILCITAIVIAVVTGGFSWIVELINQVR